VFILKQNISMKSKFTLSKKSATQVLGKHHLGPLLTINEIKTGLINPVFLINGKYILKVGSQNDLDTLHKFEKEAFIYQMFDKSDIPIPKLFAYDSTGNIIPKVYLICSYLEGETLLAAYPKAFQVTQRKLAFQLGELAQKIHSVAINPLEIKSDLFGIPRDWQVKVEVEFMRYFEVIKQRHILSLNLMSQIDLISKHYIALGDLASEMSLIHGDFSANNLQINSDQIVGIFDFEMATIGDPLYDLQKLPINFQLGPNFDQAVFLSGYGNSRLTQAELVRLKRYGLSQGMWELWTTITQQFPFGDREIQEGLELINRSISCHF
jgi:aminoglycoside phosphotransferase (APT) family kinase protein